MSQADILDSIFRMCNQVATVAPDFIIVNGRTYDLRKPKPKLSDMTTIENPLTMNLFEEEI